MGDDGADRRLADVLPGTARPSGPGPQDVTAWADLLDLDEKRPVPERALA